MASPRRSLPAGKDGWVISLVGGGKFCKIALISVLTGVVSQSRPPKIASLTKFPSQACGRVYRATTAPLRSSPLSPSRRWDSKQADLRPNLRQEFRRLVALLTQSNTDRRSAPRGLQTASPERREGTFRPIRNCLALLPSLAWRELPTRKRRSHRAG